MFTEMHPFYFKIYAGLSPMKNMTETIKVSEDCRQIDNQVWDALII